MENSRIRSFTPRPGHTSNKSLVDPLMMIDEEDHEVNKQLILIHKEYDKIKTVNKKKQNFINKLKKDIKAAEKSNNAYNEDKFALDSRMQQLENYLETIVLKRKEEEKYLKSYQYLLDRIKADKYALDKELKKQQADLSQKKTLLTIEERKAKKLKEKALKDRLEINNLTENVEMEKKTQEDTLALIEKKAIERSKAVLMLEESNKNREMIADAAQGQISNTETLELRSKFLLYQFWYHFLNKKLQTELEKGGVFEEPFQRIKFTTGMQTVEEILTRFLTREEAYKDLVAAVKVSEGKILEIKQKLHEAKKHFQVLQIKEGDETIHIEKEMIRTEQRFYINYKEMSKKYEFLLQNMQEWVKKQLALMKVHPEEQSTLKLLKIMGQENQKIMEKVAQKAEGNQEILEEVLHLSTKGLLTRKNFMRYFEKNCRVSPSKPSNPDEDSALLIGT